MLLGVNVDSKSCGKVIDDQGNRKKIYKSYVKKIPMEKKCKKSKMAVWGGLKNSCEKKEKRKAKEKRKDINI